MMGLYTPETCTDLRHILSKSSSLTEAGHMGNVVMVWYVRVYIAVTNMDHKHFPTLH